MANKFPTKELDVTIIEVVFGLERLQMETVIHLKRIIQDFWASAPSNRLHLGTDEKAWAEPHVAIARGDDSLFRRNKALIGTFFWTPEEAYALAFRKATSSGRGFCRRLLIPRTAIHIP